MNETPSGNSTLTFFVNGKKVIDENVDPEWTLLYYLRDKLRLCGTKLGCAEGGCGACTVMVSKFDRTKNEIVHLAVNACLAPVCSMHGLAVTTVEGIGSVKSRLHPVQERIAKSHGSQCGFCTPGIVMSMYTLLRSLPGKPTMHDLEIAFQGNLCRCTGYRPIIEGYRTFTEEWEEKQRGLTINNGTCGLGENCCKNKSEISFCNGVNGLKPEEDSQDGTSHDLFNPKEFRPYDSSQEPIFPPELKISDELDKQYLIFSGKQVTWYRPTNLKDLLFLKMKFPMAKLVNGNTEIGVEVKFKNYSYPVMIHPNLVSELTCLKIESAGIRVGAAITLTDLQKSMNEEIRKKSEHSTQIFKAITEILHWFAGKQIRNVGTIGGNIMTGSPISDLNPIFMAGGCELELISSRGVRNILMDEKFWKGYRKSIIEDDEILSSIFIPFTQPEQYFFAYKQAKRRDDDIAIVNAAFNLEMEGNKIKKIKMAFGGMAPTTVMALKTASKLGGREWNEEMLNDAYISLIEDLPLHPGAPGGMAQYRRSLTLSFFFKFYLTICDLLHKRGLKASLSTKEISGTKKLQNLTSYSSQYFTLAPSTREKTDLIGQPIVHLSGFKQATGEAVYCDDMPKLEGELYLSLVLSSKSHAKLISIDATKALKIPGVVAFFCADDIPKHRNNWGPIVHDEQVFAIDKVTCQGQVIGAIVAEEKSIAQKAKYLVNVQYEDLKPVITIEDAIRENSFHTKDLVVKRGDTEKVFASATNILEGELKIGGQEHFYLETHTTVVNPKKEDDEFEVYSSTQHPTELQHLMAHILDIPANRITSKVKRMGGGFGGKEARSSILALPLAVAAHKLKRPVRAMLDRDEDMIISGQRHPFMGRYKVAFTAEGKILACELNLFSNAGHTLDLSDAVMERAMFHFENGVYIPNVTCYGHVCKTNLPSNTAFRGFGAPQAMLIGETMLRHIAETLGKDIIEITETNLYKEGDYTHFNQQLTYCTIQRCWYECKSDSKFNERRVEIESFNRENRWRKRGIAMVPTMFGISFTTLFLNQAGAFLLIYLDGSVLISHGGTEMGQGLHTKMIQVASKALGIPVDLIQIGDTSTDKVPNTSATAASVSSDLNGMALIDACNQINKRLKPIKEANPKGTWKEWIKAAYLERISLAASGFYRIPDIKYDFASNTGTAFSYFTYGAACSEVEIDCLTGDHQVLRTDIVMDIGESINPAIDIGQIEGGFMQGYGLFTLEDLIVSPTGTLYSRGPGTYKLPGFSDIPAEFNVSLLKGAPNPRAVYSSKAVGEPPLFLASSIFFAIREAIKAARKDSGKVGWFFLQSPATSARIRMACEDEITDKFPEPPLSDYTPWNVVL